MASFEIHFQQKPLQTMPLHPPNDNLVINEILMTTDPKVVIFANNKLPQFFSTQDFTKKKYYFLIGIPC